MRGIFDLAKGQNKGVKGVNHPLQVSIFVRNGITCYTKSGGEGVGIPFCVIFVLGGRICANL